MSTERGYQNPDILLWRSDDGTSEVWRTPDGAGVMLTFAGRAVMKPMEEWIALGWSPAPSPGVTAEQVERAATAMSNQAIYTGTDSLSYSDFEHLAIHALRAAAEGRTNG